MYKENMFHFWKKFLSKPNQYILIDKTGNSNFHLALLIGRPVFASACADPWAQEMGTHRRHHESERLYHGGKTS
jgi:hypothetical protein